MHAYKGLLGLGINDRQALQKSFLAALGRSVRVRHLAFSMYHQASSAVLHARHARRSTKMLQSFTVLSHCQSTTVSKFQVAGWICISEAYATLSEDWHYWLSCASFGHLLTTCKEWRVVKVCR